MRCCITGLQFYMTVRKYFLHISSEWSVLQIYLGTDLNYIIRHFLKNKMNNIGQGVRRNKWIVNYAMRNIRPRLKCRSVVISE